MDDPEVSEPAAEAPVYEATPAPRVGADAPGRPRRHSRRWFLAGTAAAILGAAGGAGGEVLTRRRRPEPLPRLPPTELITAIAAERALIADLDATTGGADAIRQVLRQARADHLEHLTALNGLAATYGRPAGPPATSAAAGTPRTAAELLAAERVASARSAALAARVDGRLATLLASIAACEATHAELLA